MEYKEARNIIKNQDTNELVSAVGRAKAIQFLQKALRDKDKSTRLEAIRNLGKQRATQAIGDLLPFLRDNDQEIQSAVIETLSRFGKLSVVSLIWCLEASALQRQNASLALSNIGPELIGEVLQETRRVNVGSSFHLATFLELYHSDERVRQAGIDVSSALLSEGVSPLVMKNTASKIFTSLRDDSTTVRERGSKMIGRMGVSPDISIMKLTELLDDPSESVQCAAIGGIAMFGEPSVLPNLAKKAKSKSSEVRKAVAFALGKIYTSDSAILLIPLLLEKNKTGVIEAADISLQRLGRHSLAPLISSLSIGDSRSADAIAKIGRSVIPHLIESLNSKDANTVRQVQELLAKFGEDSIIPIQQKLAGEVSLTFKRNLIPLLCRLPGVQPISILWSLSQDGSTRKLLVITLESIGSEAIEYLVNNIEHIDRSKIKLISEIITKLPPKMTVGPLIIGFSALHAMQCQDVLIRFLVATGDKAILTWLTDLTRSKPEEARAYLLALCGRSDFNKLCKKGRKRLKI